MQVWLDTTTVGDQLKVYDGSGLVAAGGVQKAQEETATYERVRGDIGVCTAN